MNIDWELDIPDTIDSRMAVFLNRWHWRGDRKVVEGELRELVTWAQAQAVGAVDPHGDAARDVLSTREEES